MSKSAKMQLHDEIKYNTIVSHKAMIFHDIG